MSPKGRKATRTVIKRGSRTLRSEFVRQLCLAAKSFEKAGEYEAARQALAEVWPENEDVPIQEGLDEESRAELLMLAGAILGWLGSAQPSRGSQETAKNLLTQSIEVFQALGRSERAAEASSDLALCYWREGAFDEARILLREALDEFTFLRQVLFSLAERTCGTAEAPL